MTDTASACPVVHGFEPLSAEFLRDPFTMLAPWREEGPIHYVPELELYFVTRYDDIEQVFLDRDTFSAANAQKPLWPPAPEAAKILAGGVRRVPTLTNADPPRHPKMRKAVLKCLTPRRLAALEPGLREYARGIIEEMVTKPVADVVADLAFPLPGEAAFSLLGFPKEDYEQLKDWSHDRVLINYGQPTPEHQVEVANNVVAFWQYTQAFVESRRDDPADDFTSDLLDYQAANPDELEFIDAVSIVYSIALAGHESTTNGIANMVLHLLRQRAAWEQLVADPSLIPNAVEEALRFDAPITGWRRITTKEVEVGGVLLPQGSELFLTLVTGHHDPDQYPEPEVFDVHRDNARSHLAFGKGVHLCIGAPLARMEMRLALELLTELAPDVRIVEEQQFDYSRNMVFHTLQKLLVEPGTTRAQRREPAAAASALAAAPVELDEPQVDEAKFEAVQRAISESALRPQPNNGVRCRDCHFYLDADEKMAFCWHERLQLLVGEDWWCHFWAERES